jgi:hypothetical protein
MQELITPESRSRLGHLLGDPDAEVAGVSPCRTLADPASRARRHSSGEKPHRTLISPDSSHVVSLATGVAVEGGHRLPLSRCGHVGAAHQLIAEVIAGYRSPGRSP